MAEREHLERFDQRLIEFYLRSGTLSKKEYEQYLKNLPDSEAIADYIVPYDEEASAIANEAEPLLTFTAAESED